MVRCIRICYMQDLAGIWLFGNRLGSRLEKDETGSIRFYTRANYLFYVNIVKPRIQTEVLAFDFLCKISLLNIWYNFKEDWIVNDPIKSNDVVYLILGFLNTMNLDVYHWCQSTLGIDFLTLLYLFHAFSNLYKV